jgi:uncharacterized protein with gpF-like domain
VKRIFVAQGKTLAKQYSTHQEVSSAVLKLHQEQFLTVLKTHYKMVMQTFGDRIHRSIKSSVFDTAIQAYIQANALSTVNDIDDTTVDIIKTVIANGQEDGLTTADIVANILDRTSDDMVEDRAWVIARTEMHAAANYASVAAAADTGLTLNKVWTATGDDRTREAHQEADGQSVPLDEPFDVDGEDVDQPGDGSAENSVNCRCCVVFEQVSDEESSDDT